MDATEQVVLAGQTSSRTARAALSPRLAPATLAAFVPGALVALAVAWAAHPLLSAVMVPVLSGIHGEWALHYPGSYLRLPGLMTWLARRSEWLTLPALAGFAGMLSAYGGQGMSAASAVVETLARLPKLIVVGAPLALLRGAAVGASTLAIQDLTRQPVSAVQHLILAFVLEALVIAIAVCVLPGVLQRDVRLFDVPRAIRHVAHYGGAAAGTLGAGLAAIGLLARVALWWVTRSLVPGIPEAMLVVVLADALITAIGVVVFAGASMLVADAANEAWA